MYCHFFGLKWPKPAASFLDLMKLSLRWLLKTLPKNYAKDYDAIYCNSLYTKNWLKKIWHVDAQVMYPPIDIPARIGEKKNIILSLGRLTPDKNYEFVIECFKNVYDSIPEAKGFECWICGSEPTTEYLLKLKNASVGYPIKIIITSQNREVGDIYSKSKIFMQAKGLGVDEQKYPALLEHFGMTPVEAMAHGSVPILLNKGGYKESVEDRKSGFLFSTKEQAIEKLKLLIKNPKLLKKMSIAARHRAKKFSLERMQKDLDRIMEKVKLY
jgi:glycosyltransferase involved in cell wall biosynthesis